MREKSNRQNRAAGGSTPRPAANAVPPEGNEPPESHVQSPTALAGEALRTGVSPAAAYPQEDDLPGDSDRLRAGEVDTSALQNAFVGDEAPGGDMPTPDQDLVDEIGRAYGVQEVDSGVLRASSEVLDARDRHRAEMDAPQRTHGTRDDDRNRNR
jgi:uncharacterized protein DUF6335